MDKAQITTSWLITQLHANWSEACSPASDLVIMLYRSVGLMKERIRQAIKEQGLSFAEFDVLSTLRTVNPPHQLSPTELYQLTLFTSGGMSKLLHKLEKEELISRHAKATDSRYRYARLTEKGKLLTEHVMAAVATVELNLIDEPLSREDQRRLKQILGKMLIYLEERD